MSRLFNAYVMIDWSAAAAPREGKDSIWIGVTKRDIRFRPTFEAFNPPTREAAMVKLREILADLRRRGENALVGFDFSLGYPRGTAQALKLKTNDWAAMWAFLGANVADKPNNVNNRFAVAAKMNRLMTDHAWPFWGCPPKDAQTWLSSTKPTYDPKGLPPQLRLAEEATGGKAKTAWQVFGNGTVGSQAITGIPRVRALAAELGDKAKVWPFQTGWKALAEADLDGLEVLFAEVYPALVETKPEPGEVTDRAHVRALCEHFTRLDEAGKLGAAFAPIKAPSDEDREIVEREEGWILGV